MIPSKAIKPIRKNGRDNTEIAVGTLIAYRVFPHTSEGIEQAKKLIASSDEWLVPSLLPEYYDGIDSDLMTGKENDAIRAIRKQLKEFYNISSAGTTDFVDTSVVDTKPKTPAGIQIQWFSVNQVGPTTWKRLKAQLTGDGYFSEVKLSEKDADELISNIKKRGEFPSLKDQSGIHNEVYQNWLVDTYLPNYGKTQVYNPGDKFVDDGKEFADKIVDDLDTALEEKSDEIMDAIDAIIAEDKRRIEEFKAKVTRKVNHPELFSELQHIKTRYMWGQNGLYDLEFKSDIDRAIYFAGKLGGNNKDSQDKVAVRQWLFLATGLNVRDDYEEVKEYRAKILELILQLVKLKPDETEVIVPPVYDGYYQDPDEDEEEDEEEMDDEDYDDLYGSNLDDLLNEVREDEKEDQDDEQVIENIEEEIVDAAGEDEDDEDFGSEDDIPDELLQDEVDPELLEQLLDKINKPKKESTYTSNKKIFDAIVVNFGRIQATLDTVNKNLENQNELIKASIETQLAIGELISSQTNILEDKFGLILQQFEAQANISQQQSEVLESKSSENKLEAQRDAAGISDYQDLTKGPQKKKRENKLVKYLKSRLTRKLYRKLPKSVRNARQKVRKLQRLPGKAQAKVANKITSILPTQGKRAVGALSKVRGMGNVGRMAGPARYVFAGLEYADRKQSGQSEVQALSGVGGGLAGAAAGGAVGAKAGAALGAAIGVWFGGVGAAPGAAIGAVLGGLVGSIGGGMAGGAVADKVTGAHETGTGLTKPGTAILHGTEAVVKKDAPLDMSPMSTLGGVMLAATSQYINSAGAVAAPIAPTFKGIAGQMAKEYDIPSTVTQTNVGGSLPQLDKELKKVKEKRTGSAEEEFTGKEKELLDTQNEDLFAERLLSMIDPEGKLENLLKNLNTGGPGGGGGGGGGGMDLNLIGDGAFDTGLKTGPSGVIGGSAAYHQDLSFGPNVSMEDKRKLILQMAVAYDRVGRRMMLSNEGVHGDVFPVNGTKQEQIKWITDAEAAHRARNGGTGRNAIDFYTPTKGEDMFGSSVENAPMLAPVIEGAETRYSSGGGAGAGMSMVKDGVEILKLIHGRTDIALPKGGKIPSTIAKPQQPQPTPSATATATPPAQAVSSTSQFSAAPNNLMASVTNLNSPTYNNFISPASQSQQNTIAQIEQLSSQEEQSTNDMMIINNQQSQMPTMPASQPPMMFNSPGKTSSELMKDLLLQRLTA